MAETSFHTTYLDNRYLLARAENGSQSGLRRRGCYRFGFNGQEMDNEISGQTGTHTTAMFWEYDARLGRRWNLDPKAQISISDYACFANNPVWFCDVNGDEVDPVDKKSGRRMQQEIRRTFRGRENRAIRKMFKYDKENGQFETIDEASFNNAACYLDDDTRNLAEAYVVAINSDEVHTVEMVRRREKFASPLSNVSEIGDFNRDGNINGADADDYAGGGFNYNTETGSHTVIVMNSKAPIRDYYNERKKSSITRHSSPGELLSHELLGHGLTYFMGGNHHVNAIQMTNLYNRVYYGNPHFFRFGTFHGGSDGIPLDENTATGIPPYLQPPTFDPYTISPVRQRIIDIGKI